MTYRLRQGLLLLFAALALALANAGLCEGVNANGMVNKAAAVDPIGADEGFSAVLYNNINGLPTSEANAIAETSDGFIWVGSYSGLIQYDGSAFTRIESTTGITSVRSLFVDSRDRLWIGTNDNGLFLMERKQLRHWGKQEGLGTNMVRKIVEDASGAMYIAAGAGLNVIDQDLQMRAFADERISGEYILDLCVGREGIIYGLTEGNDVFTIENGRIVRFLSSEDSAVKRIDCLVSDPSDPDRVYLACNNRIVCRGSLSRKLQDITVTEIAPLNNVLQLEVIDGRLWICARNGIGIVDGDGFHLLEGIPMNNAIGHVMVDYEGNLWFTSTRQGVMKIVPNRFLNLYERYNLPGEVVNTTCLSGDLLFIGRDTGLTVVGEDGPLESLPLRKAETASGVSLGAKDLLEMLDGCRIRSIIRDSRERVWISVWNKYGLLRYDDGELTAFTTEDGLISGSIRTVCETADGRFLVALMGGVNVIEGDRVTRSCVAADGLGTTDVLTVAEGLNGEIIAGTDGGGIYIFRDSGTEHIGMREGLSSDIVMRIKRDRQRDIFWMITSNTISYMTADGKVTAVRNFPYSNNYDLYQSSKDEMWVLSSNGIYVLPTKEMLEDDAMTPLHYSVANGLPFIATVNAYSDLSGDGKLYIAGQAGVNRVNLEAPSENASDLKAVIPFLEADGDRVYPDENGDFSLDSGVRKLTVYAYVFNYSLSDPLVSYRLEGFDKEDVTVLRSDFGPIDYTNLPGGKYQFVMQLKDPQREGSKTLSARIAKEKAIYERPQFYLTIGLILSICLAAGIRVYIRKKMEELEQEHQEEKEKERIGSELEMAYRLQGSMLPSDFPPFPDRHEFDIYALMNPAKEVGGDFYDFFLIDDDHLCLVMADVSGKGVPGALFMMVSKVIIKSCAMLGQGAAGILGATNDRICSNNKMQMFVTVWLGILEISTGKITAANAGHEYPAICRNGRFELFKDKHGFVIGGMEGMKYREYELQLQPGDKLFLYTDGVPEATASGGAMFGTNRMIAALNAGVDSSPEGILGGVRRAVDAFVGDAEQFDDLTMLCLEYKGPGQVETRVESADAVEA